MCPSATIGTIECNYAKIDLISDTNTRKHQHTLKHAPNSLLLTHDTLFRLLCTPYRYYSEIKRASGGEGEMPRFELFGFDVLVDAQVNRFI